MTARTAEARLAAAGLRLPIPPTALGTYSLTARAGSLLFLSGHGPFAPDAPPATLAYRGRVGEAISQHAAEDAASLCALAMLSSCRKQLGSRDRVRAFATLRVIVLAAGGCDLVAQCRRAGSTTAG
jgi:enamine deaminase RidA (YjgF/YER057c/UK114 family)